MKLQVILSPTGLSLNPSFFTPPPFEAYRKYIVSCNRQVFTNKQKITLPPPVRARASPPNAPPTAAEAPKPAPSHILQFPWDIALYVTWKCSSHCGPDLLFKVETY
jgi:hypothetical protein